MSTVWDRTTGFLGDNLAALGPLVLLGIFVPLALLGIFMPLIGSGGDIADWVLGIVVVALSLVTSWAGLAITALAFDPSGGRDAAVAIASRRLLPLIGVGLVTLLVLFILVAPIGIVLGMSGIDMNALATGRLAPGDAGGGALVFVGFYMLVLFFVLFWAYARFLVLVTPIVVMERRGLGVYARNLVLTRRIAWKVIGVILLYGVVNWIASAAAKTVFGSVFALLFGRGEGRLTSAGVLTQIVVAGVSTLFSVLAVAFVAKLYLAARDAREAIVEAS